MGGVKKKPTSKSNPKQAKEAAAKSKKEESKPISKAQRQKSSVFIDDLNDISKLQGMKSITIQAISKTLGVKISVANNYIKNLESKGKVMKVGGYSGHRIYSLVSS